METSGNGGTIVQLRIKLEYAEPEVWRRILVPATITFRSLHTTLNAVMGWYDSHLHLFNIADEYIGDKEFDDEDAWLSERKMRLIDFLGMVETFRYEYDFGDGWIHEVEIEDIIKADPNEKYPLCIDGKNACPPEDCGGPPGFETFKKIMANTRHREHKSMREWLGHPWVPDRFILDLANRSIPRRKQIK
jgi:hypothetical protein